MRKAFVQSLIKMATEDSRIFLLTGDLGYSVLEHFQEKFPHRFINVGIAEQNLMGVATGLASTGYIPYVYSIANFATLRPYEFIRNGPVVHNSKVRIVGIGCAFEYGSAGVTHHALEDLGALRLLPGLQIIAPADDAQAESALLKTKDHPGPIYYRLSKNNFVSPELQGNFDLETMQTVREGSDALFIVMGPLLKETLLASDELRRQGIESQVSVLSHLNPEARSHILATIKKFSLIVTVESHYNIGGIGTLISEYVAEEGLPIKVIKHGVKRKLMGKTGSEAYLNSLNGLSSKEFVKSVLSNQDVFAKNHSL